MKIIFCVKNTQIDLLKDKPTLYKMSKIKLKFSKPKSISRKEFTSVSNIEFVEFSDNMSGNPSENSLRLAELYDRLMDKQLFEASYVDLDHHNLFQEYKDFNEKFYQKIKDLLVEGDLVVINDSSLFLLPKLLEPLKVRVAFRNLRFDGTFFEKVPFYREILNNLVLAQKLFDNKESLDSFNSYFECSYEMRNTHKNGCWYLKPYVDKFLVVDTLEHIKEYARLKLVNPAGLIQGKFSKRYDMELLRYLEDFQIPKTRRCILTDANLLHLEPFIKKNPQVHVRYLRTSVQVDDDDSSRMMQYLKKMYHNSFSVADPTNYSQIVAEMFYCDVFVGAQYSELAKFFGRPVIEESYDPYKLSKDVEDCLCNYENIKYNVIGEEEYLREFLSVCGYEIVINQLSTEEETINKLADEINETTKRNDCVYYERLKNDGEKELYIKRGIVKNDQQRISYEPILIGENNYYDSKNKNGPVEINPINKEKLLAHWKNSSKTILLDYDGTLTPIVNDPDLAIPSPKTIEILKRLNKVGKVVVCSGRTLKKLDEWIPKEIEVYGEHGAYHRVDGKWNEIVKKDGVMTICREVMQYYQKRTPGTQIEEKNTGLTFHFREAKNFCVDKLYNLLRKIGGNKVELGKCVVDLKGCRKDSACLEIKPDICVGDDVTDEDMFKVCKGMSVKIGSGVSLADGYFENVEDFLGFLEILSNE